MCNMRLLDKYIGDIKGEFYVPDYQRGYRWEKTEIEALLNDIYEFGNKKEDGDYCLQPIVVRNINGRFELIDGQQRLTSLFLIYVYMHKESNGFIDLPKFSISYETRAQSAEFLVNPDESRKEENIDFYFIYKAYKIISEWFSGKDKKSTLTNINTYFDECVKIIWYEVPDSEDSEDLFTRLNIGKIPLTNSELVKALFLKKNNENEIRQEELSLEWDIIEKELHNDDFWSFLTNTENDKYETRVDLVLDLLSQKEYTDKEIYRTFYYFDNQLKEGKSLVEVWGEIQHTFLTLKEWFKDHNYYHKIGYLIASGYKTLLQILNDYADKSKTDFKIYLDKCIKDSITFDNDYEEFDYINNYNEIKRLLLLFNVESVRKIDKKKQRFPFERFKKEKWSLEHIHAQHSEGLQTNEKRLEWLKAHKNSLSSIGEQDELLSKMESLIEAIEENSKKINIGLMFDEIQQEVVNVLSPKAEDLEYIHLLSNMALISSGQNSALSNYTFDAKRNIILEKDRNGEYIPYCTKMVFLKYYTLNDTNLHFWGKSDRDAYIEAMKKVFEHYLKKDVTQNN